MGAMIDFYRRELGSWLCYQGLQAATSTGTMDVTIQKLQSLRLLNSTSGVKRWVVLITIARAIESGAGIGVALRVPVQNAITTLGLAQIVSFPGRDLCPL